MLVAVVTACPGNHDLRGTSQPSADGGTYLIVADDNGGKCGPLLLDGVAWEYGINRSGPVKPGLHHLSCGTQVEFTIDSGTTFRLTYWGP